MNNPKTDISIKTVIVILIILGFILILCFNFLNDNKYTHSQEQISAREVTYLVGDWKYYPDMFMDEYLELDMFSRVPEEIFLGQYSGFDLGDPDRPKHGKGTYKINVDLDSTERNYALEVPQIYTDFRIWINGEEESTKQSLISIKSKDSLEIVIAVRSDKGLYGGLVYPPAFGVFEEVYDMMVVRLLVHLAAIVLALGIGLFYFIAGFRFKFSKPYAELFILSIAFAFFTAYPIYVALKVPEQFYLLEKIGYYGFFVLLVIIQGRVLDLKRAFYICYSALGILLCIVMTVFSYSDMGNAGTYFVLGNIITVYKWATAVWLISFSVYGLIKKRTGAIQLFTAYIIVAIALLFDRVFPMYEPILFGWPMEIAGFAVILLTSWILWEDTVNVYRQNLKLAEEKKIDAVKIKAQQDYVDMQRNNIANNERQIHETRNKLFVIRNYADGDENNKLIDYIDTLLGDTEYKKAEYSGNALIDSILNYQFIQARENGIYVEYEISKPVSLGNGLSVTELSDAGGNNAISENDITALLMNILNNAIEACLQINDKDERWLKLVIQSDDAFGYSSDEGGSGVEGSDLKIECYNSTIPHRPDKGEGHGYGKDIMNEIIERNHGQLTINDLGDSYSIIITLSN